MAKTTGSLPGHCCSQLASVRLASSLPLWMQLHPSSPCECIYSYLHCTLFCIFTILHLSVSGSPSFHRPIFLQVLLDVLHVCQSCLRAADFTEDTKLEAALQILPLVSLYGKWTTFTSFKYSNHSKHLTLCVTFIYSHRHSYTEY